MEVICPNCGNKFNWQPPEDTVVYKMLTSKDLKEKKRRLEAALKEDNPEEPKRDFQQAKPHVVESEPNGPPFGYIKTFDLNEAASKRRLGCVSGQG